MAVYFTVQEKRKEVVTSGPWHGKADDTSSNKLSKYTLAGEESNSS